MEMKSSGGFLSLPGEAMLQATPWGNERSRVWNVNTQLGRPGCLVCLSAV